MAHPILVEEEVSQGVLVEPFGHALPLSSGYYAVLPRNRRVRPSVEAMKTWLIEEAAASAPGAAGT